MRAAANVGAGLDKEPLMLEAIIVILFIGWLLGFFAFHVGSVIHILLVLLVVAIIFRTVRGVRYGR